MALAETKLRLSRIVLSAAVFISLCVPTLAEEIRHCYWCGPLAEQVHRSQRAPPCTGPYSQVTVCDSGFPYCAVVATSPPYIESRYCVKMYQDECYSLYCNSSRTWRMTCPCRGDLCNGPNTDREDDAFGGLAKIVAKTQNSRIKRGLMSSGFISMNTNRENLIENNTNIEENNNILNDTTDDNKNEEVVVKNNESLFNHSNATADFDNKEIENQMSDTTVSTKVDVKSDESQINETSPTPEVEVQTNESQVNETNVISDKFVKNSVTLMNETSIQIDIPSVNAESSDLKTEIILMSSETTKLVNDTKTNDFITNIPELQTSTPEMIKQMTIELNTMAETSTEAAKTTQSEVTITENKVKTSEQLPTAEALQHNDTPTKTTEQLTMSTTVMSIQHTEVATEATKPRNNTAIRIDAQILTLVVGIILQY